MISQKSKYAIETVGLTKIFPDWWGRAKVIAVDNLDLRINHNEIYGLLGPNGSGKTTTLKLLLNLLHPTRGRAMLLGGNSANPKISAKIGYLPEDSYLYKYLNARETLDFYGRIFGLPSNVRKSRIDALLEMVGLTGMANRAVGTFSKGMARRIGLAQALINDPSLLILDEPTSGMDPIGTRQIKDLLVQLAQRGKTILLCSHLLADVEDVCDRIGILYGGRMQIEGPVSGLLQHTEKKQIVTGPVSQSALNKICDIVSQEDASCEVSSPMVKLEEYFINIVTAAQQQKLPTSGAVSTIQIGDFLGKEKPAESILDKLVSASVQQSIDSADDRTEKVETPPPQPEQKSDLLEKLVKTAPAQPEIQTEKAEPIQQDEPAEQVKRSVLEQLMGNKDKDAGTTETTNPRNSGEVNDE